MLNIQLLRDDKETVINGLKKKNFKNPEVVDLILEIDAQRRKLQQQNDEIAARSNAAAKQIGQLMGQGKKDEAEQVKQSVASNKEHQRKISEQLGELEAQQFNELVKLPNMPSEYVPDGITAEENVVMKIVEHVPQLPEGSLPHWELAAKYGLIDFETGTKITGSGFPVYTGAGARLQRALINYFLDYNTERGYQELEVPIVVNEASGFGTGQLPDKEGQMYHVQNENLYLIPTAEVPLTNIYRDEILSNEQLPVLMTGYTPCFRREAGSYGKDVRGLNRLHQFDKVEIVAITRPADSYAQLQKMVDHVEGLLGSLQLPYRILKLCGGDMSFASALTYDFEVWSAAQERWLEVSSVSNFEAFQTNRMKIRYKDDSGKTQLLHSLNGSSLALPRIVACLLENNQKENGIHLPEVLKPYLKDLIIS
ncbi:MAG: serine--tRNA ligase [Taibaiella sp.]|nr:serine--tRNA ligase [Taibaiella sp.]